MGKKVDTGYEIDTTIGNFDDDWFLCDGSNLNCIRIRILAKGSLSRSVVNEYYVHEPNLIEKWLGITSQKKLQKQMKKVEMDLLEIMERKKTYEEELKELRKVYV